MLDLEITPEKSISSEKWQIILGKRNFIDRWTCSSKPILKFIIDGIRHVAVSGDSNIEIKL